MEHIKLQSPYPRNEELNYEDFDYKIDSRIYLPHPSQKITTPISEVLETRQSGREYNHSIDIDDLSDLLWFSAKTRKVIKNPNGSVWKHSPTPSAGGRHPIDIIITNQMPDKEAVYLYDSVAHALCELQINLSHKNKLWDATNEIIPVKNATAFYFAAQFVKTFSKYYHGESLVWRDSGSLLTTLYVVATSLKFECCALGFSGAPWLSKMVGGESCIGGVGGFLCAKK